MLARLKPQKNRAEMNLPVTSFGLVIGRLRSRLIVPVFFSSAHKPIVKAGTKTTSIRGRFEKKGLMLQRAETKNGIMNRPVVTRRNTTIKQ